MSVRIKGDESQITEAIQSYPIIIANAVASREPGTMDFEMVGDGNADIREAIFSCMSANSLPILMMKPVDLSLEDIFLQITGEEEAAS